jgi:hypothetical protein
VVAGYVIFSDHCIPAVVNINIHGITADIGIPTISGIATIAIAAIPIGVVRIVVGSIANIRIIIPSATARCAADIVIIAIEARIIFLDTATIDGSLLPTASTSSAITAATTSSTTAATTTTATSVPHALRVCANKCKQQHQCESRFQMKYFPEHNIRFRN